MVGEAPSDRHKKIEGNSQFFFFFWKSVIKTILEFLIFWEYVRIFMKDEKYRVLYENKCTVNF